MYTMILYNVYSPGLGPERVRSSAFGKRQEEKKLLQLLVLLVSDSIKKMNNFPVITNFRTRSQK